MSELTVAQAIDLTQKSADLLRAWQRASERVDFAQRELNSAATDLLNATNQLGKWMVPDDAKVGEEFHIWVGDGLLRAVKLSADSANYQVEWRKKPSPSAR